VRGSTRRETAACFPRALDRPTVMTIVAFGKRLSASILEKEGGIAANG
jgi:hypothetical protein